MAAQAPITSTWKRTQFWDRLFRWSMLWLKAGILISGLALAALQNWIPAWFGVAGYCVGMLTTAAFLYLMHYLVLVTCGRTVLRISLPLVVLIDVLALGGVIALFLRVE